MIRGKISAALAGLCLLGLSACNWPTSQEVMQSKIGQSLDTVIATWGYPTGQRDVRGRDLLIWEQTTQTYDGVPSVSVSVPVGSNGRVGPPCPWASP